MTRIALAILFVVVTYLSLVALVNGQGDVVPSDCSAPDLPVCNISTFVSMEDGSVRGLMTQRLDFPTLTAQALVSDYMILEYIDGLNAAETIFELEGDATEVNEELFEWVEFGDTYRIISGTSDLIESNQDAWLVLVHSNEQAYIFIVYGDPSDLVDGYFEEVVTNDDLTVVPDDWQFVPTDEDRQFI